MLDRGAEVYTANSTEETWHPNVNKWTWISLLLLRVVLRIRS